MRSGAKCSSKSCPKFVRAFGGLHGSLGINEGVGSELHPHSLEKGVTDGHHRDGFTLVQWAGNLPRG